MYAKLQVFTEKLAFFLFLWLKSISSLFKLNQNCLVFTFHNNLWWNKFWTGWPEGQISTKSSLMFIVFDHWLSVITWFSKFETSDTEQIQWPKPHKSIHIFIFFFFSASPCLSSWIINEHVRWWYGRHWKNVKNMRKKWPWKWSKTT